jgi:structural maintenance of chromosome 3 (chondroitin sulfate proteoglycan 6)
VLQVNKKGAIEGGFVDTSAGRLVHVANLYNYRQQAEECAERQAAIDKQCALADQRVVAHRGEETKLEVEKAKARDLAVKLASDAERNRAQADDALKTAVHRRNEGDRVRSEIALLSQRASEVESELSSDMSSRLTAEEEKELEQLTPEQEKVNKQLATAGTLLMDT